jgi:hypothetical protein
MSDGWPMTEMLAFLGLGWNAGVVGGSTMLIGSVPASLRSQTEGIGEVAMGLAAGGRELRSSASSSRSATSRILRVPARSRVCSCSPRCGSAERSSGSSARGELVRGQPVEVVMIPTMSGADVRYAWNHEVALAYQVVGQGPIDLLYMQSSISNVEVNW